MIKSDQQSALSDHPRDRSLTVAARLAYVIRPAEFWLKAEGGELLYGNR
jgi:hypothetical protein